MNLRKLCWVFTLIQFLLVRSENNITKWAKSRQKRFLIWTDSGSTKLSISMSIPANLYDKKKFRSFNLTFNFQFQYNMPTRPLYWWNSLGWKLTRSGKRLMEPEVIDLTATFIYTMIESYMTNTGVNGRQCLQRAICENAQIHQVEGLFERIYQRLLTPEDSMEEYYKDPYLEGSKGVDCVKTYNECPIGASVFDKFVQYQETSE